MSRRLTDMQKNVLEKMTGGQPIIESHFILRDKKCYACSSTIPQGWGFRYMFRDGEVVNLRTVESLRKRNLIYMIVMGVLSINGTTVLNSHPEVYGVET